MASTGTKLWLIVWRAYDALREHADRHIESIGLGFSDFAVLEYLLHKGPAPVNTIGSKIRLTSGSITAAVDRLEKKGLVERRNDPGDRRARIVHLTDAGEKTIRCAFADHEVAMARATSGLNEEEKLQTIALVRRLGLEAQSLLPGRKSDALSSHE